MSGSEHDDGPGVDLDTGVTVALLDRLCSHYLPRALDIQRKIQRGGRLDEFDIRFLDQAVEDALEQRGRLAQHPELTAIIGKMVHLYHEITAQALANEEHQASADAAITDERRRQS